MDRPIDRRDFLNGIAIALTGSLLRPVAPVGAQSHAPAYPPALTGLRGSHPGSFEVAHSLLKGNPWTELGPEADTGEAYDLVVVGGGISGLAAAYFYREARGSDARILVLDNHDDFGGHAKRNEFRNDARFSIGYGGSQSIDTPSRYSDVARGLLEAVGIDLDRFYRAFDQELYRSLGLSRGDFFDRETFGVDRLVARGDASWKDYLARTPLSKRGQSDLRRLHEDERDTLEGKSAEEKREMMARTSYRDFLRDVVGLGDEALAYYGARTNTYYGIGIDGISALEAWVEGYPGVAHLLPPEVGTGRPDPYIFHFPDGNAGITRLLVRSLVPGVAPGRTMEDVVTAPFDYGRLDEPESPVRIRLNSTVVDVRHLGDPVSADEIRVSYVRDGHGRTVRGKAAVLACWNSVIPYLCSELPERQKKALAEAVKLPLVYANVFVRNWTSFEKLGVSSVYCPRGYFTSISLDFPVSLGAYRHPRSPEEPMILHLVRTPTSPGLPPKEQFRTGRYELQTTSFEDFEREIRAQLGRVLGDGGFDPARDIEAITVNRWPHGYAYEYVYMGDQDLAEDQRPNVIGRQPFGRIAIANSDAAGSAYVDAAIDEAHRAVEELLSSTV